MLGVYLNISLSYEVLGYSMLLKFKKSWSEMK